MLNIENHMKLKKPDPPTWFCCLKRLISIEKIKEEKRREKKRKNQAEVLAYSFAKTSQEYDE